MDWNEKFVELSAKDAKEVITRGVFQGSMACALLYFAVSFLFSAAGR